MGRFIIKHINNVKPQKKIVNVISEVNSSVLKEENTLEINENKIEENKQVMTTSEKVQMAQSVLGNTQTPKRLKKDKGLIERTESSRTILTEDNKELLND